MSVRSAVPSERCRRSPGFYTGSYLLDALEKVEAEKQAVCEQLAQVEQEIEVATVKRPTAAQVQEVWSEMLALWDEGTEEERQELTAAFVTWVEVKEKDRASMELMATPTGYGQKFVTKSQMGAGAGLEPATFGL